MAFGLLHEYRTHTSRVERKVQEAHAFLHTSQAFLCDIIEKSVDQEDLLRLQTMLGHAGKALNEVSN